MPKGYFESFLAPQVAPPKKEATPKRKLPLSPLSVAESIFGRNEPQPQPAVPNRKGINRDIPFATGEENILPHDPSVAWNEKEGQIPFEVTPTTPTRNIQQDTGTVDLPPSDQLAPAGTKPTIDDKPEQSLDAHARGAGLPNGIMDYAQSINDLEDEDPVYQYEGLVPFRTGLQYVLTKDDMLMQDFLNQANRMDLSKGPPTEFNASPKPEQGGAEAKYQREAVADMEAKKESDIKSEENAKIQEIADARPLQSWHSILAFVVLSKLIGPQMAFLFFNDASKRGKLEYELNDLRERKKMLRQQQEQSIKQDWEMRSFAAKHDITQEDKNAEAKKQRRFQFLMMQQKFENAKQLLVSKPPKNEQEKIEHKYITSLISSGTLLNGMLDIPKAKALFDTQIYPALLHYQRFLAQPEAK